MVINLSFLFVCSVYCVCFLFIIMRWLVEISVKMVLPLGFVCLVVVWFVWDTLLICLFFNQVRFLSLMSPSADTVVVDIYYCYYSYNYSYCYFCFVVVFKQNITDMWVFLFFFLSFCKWRTAEVIWTLSWYYSSDFTHIQESAVSVM